MGTIIFVILFIFVTKHIHCKSSIKNSGKGGLPWFGNHDDD